MSIWQRFKTNFLPFEQAELSFTKYLLERIRLQEQQLFHLPDLKIKEKARNLRSKAQGGTPLDDLLIETFSLVSEIAFRTISMRPFDVQIIGGIILHGGNIAEMKTGEGKTLVATLQLCLNALCGKGAHLVTVNDYLAKRDAHWMGPIYQFMDLSVGIITEDMPTYEKSSLRRKSYECDITYVTNHELVFDYLRDNLVLSADEIAGREKNFALVDEVDFLLLDEATTPLIISGPAKSDHKLFKKAYKIVSKLQDGLHYEVDYKNRQVSVSTEGYNKIEDLLGFQYLSNPEHIYWHHAFHNALLAHAVYQRDVDYIVKSGEVKIVDEHTGRVSPDKRFSGGLHEALEAKEGLKIQIEEVTLAKISYQNYFRLYPKLAGMTGTAKSEKEEFLKIYGLKTVVVPTNKKIIREDERNIIYRTEDEKFNAVVNEIIRKRNHSQPVLVGTVAIKDTEKLSGLLKTERIPHEVLNAKNDKKEAGIIAQAGRSSALTISTAMAGRGTDILLGGNPHGLIRKEELRLKRPLTAEEKENFYEICKEDKNRVIKAGGLAVIGTELHESRRIDDQLRGRAGRQGDPGSSCYFLSLDDRIYKNFGKRDIPLLKEKFSNQPYGTNITSWSVERVLNALCKKVEFENKAIRKDVFKYDLVIEEQRRVIYAWRSELIGLDSVKSSNISEELIEKVSQDLVSTYLSSEGKVTVEECNNLVKNLQECFFLTISINDIVIEKSRHQTNIQAFIERSLKEKIKIFKAKVDQIEFLKFEIYTFLNIIDEFWTLHVNDLEELEEGISLRSYAERDPLLEFRNEASALFDKLLVDIRVNALSKVCQIFDKKSC